MKIVQTYYISTGRKNAMYTLRVQRNGGMFGIDSYVCNLSTDSIKAEEKAEAYVDAFRSRVGETDDFKIVFDGSADFGLNVRRGKLSVQDTFNIEQLENGFFPYGKHAGTKIVDAPDSYILYFADKSKEETDNVVFAALCAACMGVALEKGLIAKREAVRAERKAMDEQSNHVGTIGERLTLEGNVISAFRKEDDFGGEYYISKVRCGNDIICYMGAKPLGTVGETIKFKATVKKHSEYQGIKSTQVNRPAHVA